MRPQPTVSLVIVNYNSIDLSQQLIAAVGDEPTEIIVVDGASPDDAEGLDELTRRRPDITLLRLPRNVGYGSAANEGARRASGEVLVIANADIVITPDALGRLAHVVACEDVAIAAPRYVDREGSLERSAHRRDVGLLATLHAFCGPFAHVARRVAPDWHPTLHPSGRHTDRVECVHVLGAFMAVDARRFREVGGFDEQFFMYREETDLCVRIRRAGGRVVHLGDVVATHFGGGSTRSGWPYQGNTNALRSHYQYLAKRHGRWYALLGRLIGIAGSALWFVAGPAPNRPLAKRALRWHLGLRVPP